MNIDALINLIKTLRGKNGCPWDKKQTPRSIAVYLIEEVYELVDAIESKNADNICEELGDVLFHILFITGIFQEQGDFDLDDIVRKNVEKMKRRHPHVFDNGTAHTADEVRTQWHKIKMKEKEFNPETSILDSVPDGLPSLIRAFRISERAARTALFDWHDISGVMGQVEEEWSEFKSALLNRDNDMKNNDDVALEFGDILFTLVNVARFAHFHPESALRDSTKKFEKRFKYMENQISKKGDNLASVPQSEKEILWKEAKKQTDV